MWSRGMTGIWCSLQTHEQPFKPRKVYFYWMIREERAPEYFEKTLEVRISWVVAS